MRVTVGKRTGCSRIIDAAARARYQASLDARRAIQRGLKITMPKPEIA